MQKPRLLIAMALFAVTVLFAACDSTGAAPAADSAKIVKDSPVVARPIQSPYPITYSSSFAIDDPKNAETILNVWKAYDAGNIAAWKDAIADTIQVQLAGGASMRISRDSTIAAVQSMRSALTAAVDEVTAVMAVKSTDKNEHWVLIWGMEKDTHKNGKTDSVFLQESWRLNSAGKADLFLQYAQQPPKKM